MGLCHSENNKLSETNAKPDNSKLYQLLETIPKPNIDFVDLEEKFKDFPEWEGERFSGQGIKKLKGYKCSLKIDELNNLREEFWVKRLKVSGIWKQIRHACILDDS